MQQTISNAQSACFGTRRQLKWFWWLGGVAAAVAGLKLYSDSSVQRAKAKLPPIGDFVTVDGVRLHYLRQGMGQPVVLLHGSGLTLQDFTLSIFDQVAAAYEAIAFDRPGYGYSERPSGESLTLALNARLLHRALQQLGIKQPILVGNSSGGSVALRYALDYSEEVAGLVLLAPSAYAEDFSMPAMFVIPDIPVLGPVLMQLLATPFWQMITPMFGAGLFAPNPPPAQYSKAMATFTIQPDQFCTWAAELKQLPVGLRAQSPCYPEINVPAVILAGAADEIDPPAVQAQPLYHAMPHAQLVLFKETGHMVHHVHGQRVLEAVRQI
jgi:pimeloyl-ACP methyl ester carboxylesterase